MSNLDCTENVRDSPYIATYLLSIHLGCSIGPVQKMHIIPPYIAMYLVSAHVAFQFEAVRKMQIIPPILKYTC